MLLKFWGMSRPSNIDKTHLSAYNRVLNVSEKTPIQEKREDILYIIIDSSISALEYWFQLCKPPSKRFSKQVIFMLRDSLITNTSKNGN